MSNQPRKRNLISHDWSTLTKFSSGWPPSELSLFSPVVSPSPQEEKQTNSAGH